MINLLISAGFCFFSSISIDQMQRQIQTHKPRNEIQQHWKKKRKKTLRNWSHRSLSSSRRIVIVAIFSSNDSQKKGKKMGKRIGGIGSYWCAPSSQNQTRPFGVHVGGTRKLLRSFPPIPSLSSLRLVLFLSLYSKYFKRITTVRNHILFLPAFSRI